MEFKKKEQTKQVWEIEYGNGKVIPMEFIKSFIQSLFIAVLIFWAYNLGQSAAYDYIAISAWMSSPHCDAMSCSPGYDLVKDANTNQLSWIVRNVTKY